MRSSKAATARPTPSHRTRSRASPMTGLQRSGRLSRSSQRGPLTTAALTQGAGFVGVNGIFRLRADGLNERGLAIAQIRDGQATIIDSAPRSFAGPGL